MVDAEKGIILTNRHVVGPGPIVRSMEMLLFFLTLVKGRDCLTIRCRNLQDAEAVFHNNEEVRVIPIYRDPVHDFGFFQFNPAVGSCVLCSYV